MIPRGSFQHPPFCDSVIPEIGLHAKCEQSLSKTLKRKVCLDLFKA